MHDRAIAQIGEIYFSNFTFNSPSEIFTENMYPGDNYKMLLITFDLSESKPSINCKYKNIDIENAGEKNYLKYAYREGTSKGGNITFTTKLNNIEKKLNFIIKKQFPNFLQERNNKDYPKEAEILKAVYKCMNQNYNQISSELSRIYNNFDQEGKAKCGLSFCFCISKNNRYLSDFEIFRKAISYSGTDGKAAKHNKISKGENDLCSICFKVKPELYGFASPFKYYTIDKRGFASNYFKQECSWKNYPICSDCSQFLEYGERYISYKLKRRFYGKSYYLVPRLIVENQAELEKVLNMITNYNEISYKQSDKKIEDLFFKYISEKENYFNLNLIFFEEDATTKAIKIKMMIEEVFPSRFRKLFCEIPSLIDKNIIYKEVFRNKNGEPVDLTFNFGILKDFFDNIFYELIYKVFLGEKLSLSMVLDKIMDVIRGNYKNRTSGYWYNNLGILKALMALEYLQKLGIVETDKNYKFEVNMEQLTEVKSSYDIEKLNNFIAENTGLFDADYKVGLFSLGMLVRVVLDIQNVNLSNTPFEKVLKGLNLNYEALTRVYTEAIAKISQYMGFYAYGVLKDFVSEYFIKTSYKLKKVPNSELSFYFTAGLEMGNQFKNKKENN